MSRAAAVPAALRHTPFRASTAIAHGLLTRSQLAGPVWRRMFRGIYQHVDAVADPLAWCHAASLLLPPGAALSHRSAALLHGATLLPGRDARAEITVALTQRMRPDPGLVVHRSRLPRSDLMRRGGFTVTNPERTTFDLGRDPDLATAVVALDALIHARVIKAATLPTIAADRTGWPGIAAFRAAAALARDGAHSPMETRLRLCLIDGGLPEPELQHEVFDHNGHLLARLDMAYRDLRLGLEYDGDHHRERRTFQRDAVRLNRLRLRGWTVLRFTSDDVHRHPDRVIAQVTVAYEAATSRQRSVPTRRAS